MGRIRYEILNDILNGKFMWVKILTSYVSLVSKCRSKDDVVSPESMVAPTIELGKNMKKESNSAGLETKNRSKQIHCKIICNNIGSYVACSYGCCRQFKC